MEVARMWAAALNTGPSIALLHIAKRCPYETRNAAFVPACSFAAGAIEPAPDELPEDFIPADGVRWTSGIRAGHPAGLGRHQQLRHESIPRVRPLRMASPNVLRH